MQNFKSIIIFCNTIGTAKSTDPPNRPTIEWPHYHQQNTTTHETRTFLSHSSTVPHQVSLPQFYIHTTFQPYHRPSTHDRSANVQFIRYRKHIIIVLYVTWLFYILLCCFVMMQRCFIDYNIMVCLIILYCNVILLFCVLLYYFVSYYVALYY